MRTILLLALAGELTGQVVISQVYGGGGNTGATWRQDFIEVFNRGSLPQDLTGWSVQYAGATAAGRVVTNLGGSLAPGQYALAQQAAGAGGTVDLPQPDFTGAASMSSSAGKVFLVNASGDVLDLVGYGVAADQFKGAPTRDLSNTTAALRARNGCQDTGNNAADFTIAAPVPRNRQSAVVNCSAVQFTLLTTIAAVQGTGATSPLEGLRVGVSGIVTFRRSNGFYLQDSVYDPNASTGIFVFTQSIPPDVAQPGNQVMVFGDVAEFRPAADPESAPLTEIINPTVNLLLRDRGIPAPVTLLPDVDLERYEGMLVQAAALNVVSPTVGGVFWGTLDSPRPFRRVNGARWPNLLRVVLPTPLTAGAKLVNVAGPLDFAARTYTIYGTGFDNLPAIPAFPPAPPRGDSEFTVATLNIQRFFDDLDQGNGVAPTPPMEFTRRLNLLKSYVTDRLGLPDVIVIEEAENLPALERAAAAIGVDYLAFTAPSNDPSGITTGFLVRHTRITVESVAQLAKDLEFAPGQVTHDRPPVLLRARRGSFAFAVMGVHMRSRLNLEDARVQAKRAAQFASVREELAQLPAGLPTAVLGDWNSFAEEIQIPGFQNLSLTLSTNDNYSYIFDGQTQTLDHILINPAFAGTFSRLHYGRGNADAPAEQRLSDHDGAVAYFTTVGVPFTASTIVSSVSFLSGPIAPNEAITIFGPPGFTPNEPPASANLRVLIDGVSAQVLYAGRDQVVALTPNALNLTKALVTVTVERNDTAVHTVLVPTTDAQPGLPTIFGRLRQLAAFDMRPGSTQEIFLTGHGVLPVTTRNTNVRLCGLAAEVTSAKVYPNSHTAFAAIEFTVPVDCPSGGQSIEVSIGSRTAQSGITVNIRP